MGGSTWQLLWNLEAVDCGVAAGRDVLLEIDWQGAQRVRKVFPAAIGIFVLRRRCRCWKRACRAAVLIQPGSSPGPHRRRARRDAACGQIDYVLINDDLQQASRDLQSVISACRLRYTNQRQRHLAVRIIALSGKYGTSYRR